MERQRVRRGIPPGQRHHSASIERATLEREKARLEQELAVWRQNQARAEERLRRVEQRLAALDPQQLPAIPAQPDPPARPEWPGLTFEY